MIIERLTTPTALPFDATDLADHVRVTDAAQIAEATRHGRAAAAEAEDYGQLALLTQTIRVTLDAWPRTAWVALPITPMPDALSVTVTVDGVAYDDFAVVAGQRPAIRPNADKPFGVVVIEYQAGFGDAASDIPAPLAHAILDQAAALFDARGLGDGKSNGMSAHMSRIVARYRGVRL
jgi:uncharacterized phiE125 gp8 family phage protein